MMCYTISAAKANRLFWLGRYTERVYLSLHLLRRYCDKMIDGQPGEYEEYYRKLSGGNPYTDPEQFRRGYMYDESNPCSLLSGLTAAHDNAIVLREEIMSETLSYIQLALCCLQRAKEQQEDNITDLQPITDYLLAFWGSIDERVFDRRVRTFLRIGRLVEYLDMHIRFDYPFYRIREAYDSLKECGEEEQAIFDSMMTEQLDALLDEERYAEAGADYKQKVLKYLNHLILL